MNKIINIFLGLVLILTISGCTEKKAKLIIGVPSWIGYAPLIYANKVGWLNKDDIKIINVATLSENIRLFDHGYTNIILGTQYEYNRILKDKPKLKVVKLLDRSNGGDMVLSNRTIPQLKRDDVIQAYLNIDSVNRVVLEDFLRISSIKKSKVELHYSTQAAIDSVKIKKDKKPAIIITYIPHNIRHITNGFETVMSTKDSIELLVVDAIMAEEKTILENTKNIEILKQSIDRAILFSKEYPHEYYELIKEEIDMSYKEYINAKNDIIWVNGELSKDVKARFKTAGIVEY